MRQNKIFSSIFDNNNILLLIKNENQSTNSTNQSLPQPKVSITFFTLKSFQENLLH